MKKILLYSLCGMIVLASCSAPTQMPTSEPTEQVTMGTLNISLLYPTENSNVEMGQSIKTILRVTDEQEHPIQDATVKVTFSDPSGQAIGSVPATFGDGDVYRSDSWTVPHHMQEGTWTITVEADATVGSGRGNDTFPVKFSTSEILYHKYGFWLDAPTLRGIQPTIGAERGDAENGLVRWGGVLPSQHVLPENWVEVQWRKGDFKLDSPEAVRTFLLSDIGDLGFTPVREIGAFERSKFKRWDAWLAPARGQYYYQEMVWTVFYAPEVDKTYAISTTVIHPPSNIDANEVLLENFDIDPNAQADGVAPAPLISLLPQPTLVSPELGARFTGLEQPIILKWEPLKELAEDEYYQVAVDYNYEETNFLVKYATRETQFTLPEALYRLPNCSVFNWRVTLMQQTGLGEDGKPKGAALSYDSLYRYVQWFYPLDDKAPFDPLCPNAQY
ncbi:MAG: hypothetical protein AB8I58_21275 [Anaerolineales bacterium]